MGYCIEMVDTTAVLHKGNFDAAVEALNNLEKTGHKSGGSYGPSGKNEQWFAWVSTDWYKSGDVKEMIEEWRYHLHENEDGNYVVEYFEGEKYGDEDQLFNALSPYMTGYIEMRGEDGEQWKWVFGGPEVQILNGRMVYED